MNELPPHDFQADIDTVGRIDSVPTILDVVCRTTGMGFAAVARVTEERWIACSVLDNISFGLQPGGELKVETTICNEIRASHQAVVIDSVADDEMYCGHHTPAMYGFQSYISMPIVRRDGSFFGTLCAIDPRPAKLNNPEVIGMFRLFAELIASHLDSAEQLDRATAEASNERRLKELREQFMAVLGHDLRNPLASIASGVKLLKNSTDPAKNSKILSLMEGSIARMHDQIEDLLDFARARMGGGIEIRRDEAQPLNPLLQQTVGELREIHPGSPIETDFEAERPVSCDRQRLARLFSNLIGNALSHGEPGAPVRTGARIENGTFRFWVANRGDPIPDTMLPDLFTPFVRGDHTDRHGLGLGLFIASEVARMHDGALEVASTTEETRFTFTMPVEAN